jgi:hypothetical protein
MNLKSYLRFVLLIIITGITVSCDESKDIIEEYNQKTLIMYMPWSDNLTAYFYQNIADMEEAVRTYGLDKERVIVYISTSETEGEMFEIKYLNDGLTERPIIKQYTDLQLTTTNGIAEILNDAIAYAPAKKYDLVIGCHGMGWLPVSRAENLIRTRELWHYDYETPFLTRYFGGTSSSTQTDISTLADAISRTGVKMEFILFDDCYMSSVELAYQLRNVTDYLVASTCEVMAYGMPYAKMGRYMFGTTDYEMMCQEFFDFYDSYSIMPCGTLAVTDCSQLDNLADIMRAINQAHQFDESQLDDLQKLDGYTPTIFYDLGDYVDHLAQGDYSLLRQFDEQLDRTVIYKVHTSSYYAAAAGGKLPIATYSGLTISDPSTSKRAAAKTTTDWYLATH